MRTHHGDGRFIMTVMLVLLLVVAVNAIIPALVWYFTGDFPVWPDIGTAF